MILDSPERIRAIVKPFPWNGQSLYLRKMTVAQWKDLLKLRAEKVRDENDEQGGFAWGAVALSKQLCDEFGQLIYDNDSARNQLEQLSADEMAGLLTAACVWSGVWSEPKETEKKT